MISKRPLKACWERHPDSKESLLAWLRQAEHEDWASPAGLKAMYRTASILGKGRAVFNVRGNSYRIVVRINYAYRIVYIRFVGTHAEYDEIDAEEV